MRIVVVLMATLLVGCSTLAPPVLPDVKIVEVPAVVSIPEEEDWVEAVDDGAVCRGGILMGDGKALRCAWYKAEFERFSELYQAEARVREREHEAVNEYLAAQGGVLSEYGIWIGGAVGVLVGIAAGVGLSVWVIDVSR